MKSACLLLVVAVACVKTAKPSTPATLTGIVHCAVGLYQSANIKVRLVGAVSTLTLADNQGNYRFEGVTPGHYLLSASADATREGEVEVGIDVAPDADTMAPELSLTPSGSVSGRITIAGAQSGNGGVAVTLDGSDFAVSTDDSGAFTLPRVAVGTYRLRAQKLGVGGRTLRGLMVRYAQDSNAGTLEITPGISAEFNHPPQFSKRAIDMTRYRPQPGSSALPLPLTLPEGQVARYDTIALSAPAIDADGDALTYFWTVTAGALDRTDQAQVSWTVNAASAQSATVAVRIVDERSASNQLTAQVAIEDAQALSADLGDNDVVYAYRIFSGDFHVLQLDLASGAVQELATVASLSDPAPQHLGGFIHLVTDADGALHHFFFRPGETPVERTTGGNERGVAAGALLVQSQSASATVGWGYDPSSDSGRQLFTCGSAGCGAVAGSRGTVAAFINRSAGNVINLFDVASGAQSSATAQGDVGGSILVGNASVICSDVGSGSGRSVRNNVREISISGHGFSSAIYAGLYDVFLGGFDGDFFGFTEQQYREVYAPETAYLYRRSTHVKSAVDTPEVTANVFAYDRVLGIANGRVLLRRYTRADWLKDTNRTHYQVVQEPTPP